MRPRHGSGCLKDSILKQEDKIVPVSLLEISEKVPLICLNFPEILPS